MLYFKKVEYTEHTQAFLETSLRKVSLKRSMPLDFDFSTMNIGTEKFFFANELKNDLRFTRIRTSFEHLFPKLVVKIKRGGSQAFYKVRLTFLSTMALLFFSFLWMASIVTMIKGNMEIDVYFMIWISYALFWGLLVFELKLTTNRVSKAIKLTIDLWDRKPVHGK